MIFDFKNAVTLKTGLGKGQGNKSIENATWCIVRGAAEGEGAGFEHKGSRDP